MTTTTPLRMALGCNAAFSSICGASMLLAPSTIAAWLGIDATSLSQALLQGLGAGLLIFAADLIHQATRPRLLTWRALYASTADLLWVGATALLLLGCPSLLGPSGVLIAVALAVVVATMAVWQLWAIDRAHRVANGRHRHCISVATPTPAPAMWAVIAELGEIQRYMPSLKHSGLLDGAEPGAGAVRQCEDHRGKRWSEACTSFEPPHRFDVRFLADEPGFPFPARAMDGGWEVLPEGEGSVVRVWWELIPTPRLLAPVLLPLLAFQVDRDFSKVIERMATAGTRSARQRQDNPESDSGDRPRSVRLLPYPC